MVEFFRRRKKLKSAAKSVDDRFLENSCLVVAGKGLKADSFRRNLQNKPVGREETFSQTLLMNHFQQYWVPTFCGSFWKSLRLVPVVDGVLSSREQEICPTTSLDGNCREIKFHTNRNHHIDLRHVPGFETEICQGSWLQNIQYQNKEKRTERRSKIGWERDGGEGAGGSSSSR